MNVLLISAKKASSTGGIAVWTNHYLSRCEQHDLHCTLVNTEKGTDNTFGGFSEISRTRRIYSDLRQTLKNGTFDLAHLNTSCGPFGLYRDYAIALHLKKKGIPVVTHYHCDIPKWINNSLRRRVLKRLAHVSAQIFTLCENSRAYLEELGAKAVKVPNFVEESVVATQPKTIRDALSRIFFVGRISTKKGAAEIFELARRFPDKTFALAGLMVPPVDSWDKPSNIHHMGAIPYAKVLSTLDEADLFLFPSHSEGFSMALMEAMARGVPAIAVDSVGANADMLADSCGVTVPLGDVDAMERAVRELEDPALRATISRNAMEKVKQHYTTDAVLALFKTHYDALI